ncbi:hypothetical protein K523DRAFT_251219 [Schizophyllum commune Tattone D]|nr:hypothetical protein K523DRAFT_251219 [Schizophyllum commune Tattone D]
MLDAFKLKGFDLEPVYAEWKDGPKFTGDPKRDKPVDEWLEEIKAGCKARGVPKECWHKVGQHFMGDKARARLDELKAVMAKVNGGSYRWTWEKFKIAMRNMGWNIDASETETIKVEAKSSGQWWFSRKNGQREEMDAKPPSTAERKPRRRHTEMPPPSAFSDKKSRRSTSQSRSRDGSQCEHCSNCGSQSGSKLKRSSSSSTHTERSSKDDGHRKSKSSRESRPAPSHSKSEMIPTRKERPKPNKVNSDTVVAAPATAAPSDETAVASGTAPTWLINACQALEFLQEEHPKAMSTLGAILITVGTIPAIPALHIGAGGAFLASGAVQAAGAIAVGVGKLLTAAGKGTATPTQPAIEGKENTATITQA